MWPGDENSCPPLAFNVIVFNFFSSYVQSICDAMDVPHILTHPELTASFGNIPRINLNGDYRDNPDNRIYEDEYSADQWMYGIGFSNPTTKFTLPSL